MGKQCEGMNVAEKRLETDILIIGGGMSYTFAKANGKEVGTSLLEADYIDYAKQMMKKAKEKDVKLLLPVDTVVAKEFSNDAPHRIASGDFEKDEMGLDIGPKTIEMFKEALKDAKTVIWNGPMGVFEMPNYAHGTMEIAKALAELDATTIIGGGDSAAAVNISGFGDKMTHISTGGGASLEFLEGKKLPGIEAANDK
jgi:phosphoglycerate kinase